MEAWRELCGDFEESPQDIKERIDALEAAFSAKDERIESLNERIADLENEVETLKWNLEQALEPRPNQA